jgi:hypothetical protein
MLKFTLTYDAVATVVEDPIGWDALEIVLRRDLDLHGVFFEFSDTQLKFVGTGKAVLDAALAADGFDAVVDILIESRPNGVGPWLPLISGKLNLADYQRGSYYIEANAEGTGMAQLIRNRYDYVVDFDSNEAVDGQVLPALAPELLSLHSRVIVFQSLIEAQPGPVESIDYSAKTAGARAYAVPSMPVAISEVATPLEYGYQIIDDTQNTTNVQLFNDNYFVFESQNGGNYTIKINVKGLFSGLNNGLCRFRFVIGDSIFVGFFIYSENIIEIPLNAITLANFDEEREYQFTLVPFQKIWLYWDLQFDGAGTRTISVSYTELAMRIIENTSEAPSTALAYPAHNALAKTLQRILGYADVLRSSVFGSTSTEPNQYPANGEYWPFLIANGFALRSFPASEKKDVKTSLRALYEGLDAVFCLGLSIEEPFVRVEKREYFYGDTVVASFEDVDVIQSPSPFIFNELAVGYEKWEDERVNGLEAFAAETAYAMPVRSIKKRYEAQSSLIADMHAIEFQRREQYDNNSTTPEDFDNDLFVVHSSYNAPNWASKAGEDIVNVSGLFSPESVYNIAISAKRNLWRHLNFLLSCLVKKAGSSIKFLSGKAATDMQSTLVGETFTTVENGDYFIVSPESLALLSDNQVQFDAPMTLAQFNALKAVPFSAIEYAGNGESGIGNILEIRWKYASNKATIKLLKRL